MECASVNKLCSFFAGDSVEYDFLFKREDGTPINISGMTLYFTMKINKSDMDSSVNSLQESVTFPTNTNSAGGNGEMYISKSKTSKLIPERWYQFDYRLESGGHAYTVGTGTVYVKQRVRTSV